MKTPLKAKMEFEATVAASIAALLASSNPRAQIMGAELLDDLRAWRELHPSKKLNGALARLRARDSKELEPLADAMKVDGPKIWKELHLRALRFESSTKHVADELDPLAYEKMKREEAMFIRQIATRIPCSQSKRNWLEIIKANPPRLDEYFAWSVEAHNAINDNIGKRIVRIREARRKWEPRSETPNGPE